MKPSREYWVLDILETATEESEDEGVKGRLKMEKLSVLIRENIEEENTSDWDLISDFRGPRDKGLTRLLRSFDDLDIVELEQMRDDTLRRRITGKGREYFESMDRFFSKMNPEFEEEKEEIDEEVISENIDKSGEELVEMEEIQDLKDNELGDEL